MKVLIVGTGAVGGYFGGKLAEAGHCVAFIARGANLRALRERGLRVESIAGDFSIPVVDAFEKPPPGAFDLVLVCVKAGDTERAIDGLASRLAPDALVLSLQNGVESEPAIERALGLPPIVRAFAHVGAELVAPGTVRHVSGGTIVMGEAGNRRSERLERLETILREAGIDVSIPPDIERAKWQKLAWNAAFNLVAALTLRTVGEILRSESALGVVFAVMKEVEAVAASRGVTFEADYARRVLRHAARNLGHVRPSTLQDREKGKPLEHDALVGVVVRLGERSGVPTPICRTLDALASLASAAQPPG